MTPSARASLFVLAAACARASFGCASNGPRDVAVVSNDERVTDAGAVPTNGYVYIARKPHSAIGLVGAKRMSEADAVRFVDRLADEFEACAVRQEARGLLVPGAASLVVVGSANGTATVGDLQLAPGGAVAANALECLIAPARSGTLPRGTADGAAALAVEATWNPIGQPAEATDAGAADANSVVDAGGNAIDAGTVDANSTVNDAGRNGSSAP